MCMLTERALVVLDATFCIPEQSSRRHRKRPPLGVEQRRRGRVREIAFGGDLCVCEAIMKGKKVCEQRIGTNGVVYIL